MASILVDEWFWYVLDIVQRSTYWLYVLTDEMLIILSIKSILEGFYYIVAGCRLFSLSSISGSQWNIEMSQSKYCHHYFELAAQYFNNILVCNGVMQFTEALQNHSYLEICWRACLSAPPASRLLNSRKYVGTVRTPYAYQICAESICLQLFVFSWK